MGNVNMKHNFNLIPDQYKHAIVNNNLTINHDRNFISINIDLIEHIEECANTISIIVKTDNVCIWYSFYKKVAYVHTTIIKL
jgi:hypothetical protein